MPPHAWALALPWRGLVKLGLLVLLVVAANLVAGWITELLKLDIRPSNEDRVHWLILTS